MTNLETRLIICCPHTGSVSAYTTVRRLNLSADLISITSVRVTCHIAGREKTWIYVLRLHLNNEEVHPPSPQSDGLGFADKLAPRIHLYVLCFSVSADHSGPRAAGRVEEQPHVEQSAWRPLHPSTVLHVPGRIPLLLLQAGSVNYSCASCCTPGTTLMALPEVFSWWTDFPFFEQNHVSSLPVAAVRALRKHENRWRCRERRSLTLAAGVSQRLTF